MGCCVAAARAPRSVPRLFDSTARVPQVVEAPAASRYFFFFGTLLPFPARFPINRWRSSIAACAVVAAAAFQGCALSLVHGARNVLRRRSGISPHGKLSASLESSAPAGPRSAYRRIQDARRDRVRAGRSDQAKVHARQEGPISSSVRDALGRIVFLAKHCRNSWHQERALPRAAPERRRHSMNDLAPACVTSPECFEQIALLVAHGNQDVASKA